MFKLDQKFLCIGFIPFVLEARGAHYTLGIRLWGQVHCCRNVNHLRTDLMPILEKCQYESIYIYKFCSLLYTNAAF